MITEKRKKKINKKINNDSNKGKITLKTRLTLKLYMFDFGGGVHYG